MNVSLSLVAHTNVGKTSLVRTLLRDDVGEVADRPHVTEAAERHVLVESAEGDALHLWDTPGFGDSARLLKRLRNDGNPVGWLLTQVWDRFVDRPLFCSQAAVRHVREASDVVLYLVNATEDPAAAAYVQAELEILRWTGKPVLLLLNQTGPPRERAAAEADERAWHARLAEYVPAGAVLTLDAFARCWVQEERLLELAAPLLPQDKCAAFARLAAAWRARNLAVFDASMAILAAQLAQTAADHEPLAAPGLKDSLTATARRLVSKETDVDPATRAALAAVTRRLEAREREAADRLIALHGLAGNAKERIVSGLAAAIEVNRPLDVTKTGALGGVVSGALGGLAADLASGGLTLGLGAIVGGIVGALGTGGAVHAYNVATGRGEAGMRWSAPLLRERAAAAVLFYLAVAHFGRARGAWAESEAPASWRDLVAAGLARHGPAIDEAWTLAREGGRPEAVEAALRRAVDAIAREALVGLYPEARAALEPVTEPSWPAATAGAKALEARDARDGA